MALVNSVIADVSPQANALRYVTEEHTDHLGQVYRITVLRDNTVDDATELTRHAAQLPIDLRQSEISKNLSTILRDGAAAVLTLDHTTAAQMRAALREAYRNSTRQETAFLGDFLGTLTDAQLQTVFSMTAGQVTTLRANRLAPASALVSSINSAVGA